MPRLVYLNGKFLPDVEAHISIFDRGFLFSDAVYEVTAVIDKNVECSPCRKNDCTNIEDHLLCLKNISRSDIENAVNSFTNQ